MSLLAWIACEKDKRRLQDEMQWLLDSIEEIMVLKPKLDEVRDWGNYDTEKLLRMEAVIDTVLAKYPRSAVPLKGPYDHLSGNSDKEWN